MKAVLENAINAAFIHDGNTPVPVTEEMFVKAEHAILGTVRQKIGFGV